MTFSKVGAAKVGGLVSAGASSLGVLLLFGCGSLGTRAMSGCPEGEICSEATPNGLRFYGASLDGTLSNGANTIAVGGTQRLRWEDARETSRALPDHVSSSDTPSVIELTSASRGAATLTARASGSASIRITEPSGPLLDRITVSAAPLDRVRLAPGLLTNPMREVAYLEGTREVGVALLTSDGRRLVDDSAVIEGADVEVTPVVNGWDRVSVPLPAGGATLSVTTVGRTFEVEIPVAPAIDGIAINPYFLGSQAIESLEPLRVYEGGVVCFDFLWGERAVVGVEEAFTYVIAGEREEGDTTAPCLVVPAGSTGTLQIEVSVAGITRSFSAEVLPSEGSMSLVSDEPFTLSAPSRGAFGERASLLRGLALPTSIGSVRGL
ncbi:MAG: hypothetical protein J0L92_07825 [Deltaproteobacteria bacterium]|nr:hypothetical protein [Deltaproteobacteria bacterium]